jgi:hypothetical protein
MKNHRLAVLALLTTICGDAQMQPSITFMKRPYYLGSYSQKSNPMWEFVPNGETVDSWTTLVTIIDRPDAHTLSELDRLAEGIRSTYKSSGGQILMAKSMRNGGGVTFNYMLAA